MDGLPVKAHFFNGSGAIILGDDVNMGQQLQQNILCRLISQVHAQAALEKIIGGISQALPVVDGGIQAKIVADHRLLHLDDIGPHLGEVEGCVRTRDISCEIQYHQIF